MGPRTFVGMDLPDYMTSEADASGVSSPPVILISPCSECVERKLDTQRIFLPRVFHAPFVLCNTCREAKVVDRKRQNHTAYQRKT